MQKTALIVVDIQNDFCPGGALGVVNGDAIIPRINAMIAQNDTVILTQDWHPAGHSSFASSHPGAELFSTIPMPYGIQTLWPDHCVQGTHGAEFHPALLWNKARMIVRKGYNPAIDSYSTFFENDRTTPTGLAGALRELGISKLTLVGLATDFCVAYSALDARALGFDVDVVLDACAAIDLEGSLDLMLGKMQSAGVTLV